MAEAKILVVDDEKEIADLIELYLTNEAYEVRKFYNGTDALAGGVSENPGDSEFPDYHADSQR